MSATAVIEQRPDDQRRRAASRLPGRTPLVGYVGAKNTIDVIERADGVVVRVGSGTRRFLILFGTFFGPVLTIALWLGPRGLNPGTPLFMKGALYLTMAAAWFLLIYTLATRPRLEIGGDGDIRYFRRGAKPARVIHRDDLRGLTISESMYTSEGRSRVNRVLSALLTSGEVVRLCASPDFDSIAALASKAAALTRTTLLDNTNGQVTE